MAGEDGRASCARAHDVLLWIHTAVEDLHELCDHRLYRLSSVINWNNDDLTGSDYNQSERVSLSVTRTIH